jgi:hypothetical protein
MPVRGPAGRQLYRLPKESFRIACRQSGRKSGSPRGTRGLAPLATCALSGKNLWPLLHAEGSPLNILGIGYSEVYASKEFNPTIRHGSSCGLCPPIMVRALYQYFGSKQPGLPGLVIRRCFCGKLSVCEGAVQKMQGITHLYHVPFVRFANGAIPVRSAKSVSSLRMFKRLTPCHK